VLAKTTFCAFKNTHVMAYKIWLINADTKEKKNKKKYRV
jgi:hypothetical protein